MEKQQIREMIRIGGADIKGNEKLYYGLRKIKGVGFSFSNVICNTLRLDREEKIGSLSDKDLKEIESLLKNPLAYNIPVWLLNRQKDYDTGKNLHLVSTDIKFRKDFDIKRLKKIRSYRGIRHSLGLPTRGQKTKGHFRKGRAVGVSKKARAKRGKV